MAHQLTTNKKRAQKLSRQAAGILAKVSAMIEADSYCPDVIQQVGAVAGLLKSMEKELLIGHLQHCLEHRMKHSKNKTTAELLKIYGLSKNT